MVKKAGLASKIFQTEGHKQGGKRVPLPPVREYGTGVKAMSPAKKMAKKKK